MPIQIRGISPGWSGWHSLDAAQCCNAQVLILECARLLKECSELVLKEVKQAHACEASHKVILCIESHNEVFASREQQS